MTAILASNDDVQTFLGNDKLQVTDGDSSTEQVEAQRLIMSQLSGVFASSILVTWVSPETTPGLIRSIAGRIIAAYLYRNVFINESTGSPEYAMFLYNEAIAMLKQIRLGGLVVVGTDDNPIAPSQLDLTSADFWPNNSTSGPVFTMGQVFS